MPDAEAAASQLETVRDFLRWALSSFAAAKIAHGHGTTSALDEAAFIILETLHLPVDDINPWLDARLLEPERRRLAELDPRPRRDAQARRLSHEARPIFTAFPSTSTSA